MPKDQLGGRFIGRKMTPVFEHFAQLHVQILNCVSDINDILGSFA